MIPDDMFDDFDDDDLPEDGLIESRGMLFCFACGMLAAPGDEEFDWCDHRTGDGCAYMPDETDDYEDDWSDYDES